MNKGIYNLISCITLSSCLFGAGCVSKKECFGSFEQRILSAAPTDSDAQKRLRESANTISYHSLNETERTIYENMLKRRGNIKRTDFTDFEWEALKGFYGIKSPKEVTPQEYIMLQRLVQGVAYTTGTE